MTQETNNITNSSSKRLSVQISLNGLSFLVSDQKGNPEWFEDNILNHSTTPEEILMELELFFSEKQLWNKSFSEVFLIYSTEVFSLVPANLFDESRASEYLKFNSKILANDYVASDYIEDHNIRVVYVPLININNLFFDKFGSFNYYHSTTILLNAIFKDPIPDLPRIYLHLNQNSYECLIFKNGRLELCNSFHYSTPEDFIYYLLFTLEQLNLNPETVPVYLCGSIEKDDAIYSIIYRYIRYLEFLPAEKSFETLSVNSRDHQHFLLKNI